MPVVEKIMAQRLFQISDIASSNGFYSKIFYYNASAFTSADIRNSKNNLYGFGLWGHGVVDDDAFDWSYKPSKDAGNFTIEQKTYDEVKPTDLKQSYGYGLVIVKMCSSGLGNWRSLASVNGYVHDVQSAVTLPFMSSFSMTGIIETLERHGSSK